MYNHGNWEGFGHMGNYMMGGGFMFWIFMLLIVFLIFSIFKNNQHSNSQPKKDDALDILKKRFANSEINEEEYRSKREILKG